MSSFSSCCGMLVLLSYVVLTIALNLRPLVIGYEAVKPFLSRTDYSTTQEFCNATQETWLFFNLFFSLIHVVASFYVAVKVQAHFAKSAAAQERVVVKQAGSLSEPLLLTTTTGVLDIELAREQENKVVTKAPASWMRSFDYTICFDIGVTVYFVLATLWCIWQFVGVTLVYHLYAERDDKEDGCNTFDLVSALKSGLIYMSITSAALSACLVHTSGMEHEVHDARKSSTEQEKKTHQDAQGSTVVVWLS